MMKTYKIRLSQDEVIRLKNKIDNIKVFFEKGFPYFTVFLLLFVDVLLVFLTYVLVKELGFYVYLIFIFTIVPTWMILMIIIGYSKKQPISKSEFKMLNQILNEGEYEVIRVETSQCYRYKNEDLEFYLFENETNRLLMRKQDFEVNEFVFPSDHFMIPPYYLFDIIGNKIVIEGIKIIPKDDDQVIMKYLSIFNMLQYGHTYIFDKN